MVPRRYGINDISTPKSSPLRTMNELLNHGLYPVTDLVIGSYGSFIRYRQTQVFMREFFFFSFSFEDNRRGGMCKKQSGFTSGGKYRD